MQFLEAVSCLSFFIFSITSLISLWGPLYEIFLVRNLKSSRTCAGVCIGLHRKFAS